MTDGKRLRQSDKSNRDWIALLVMVLVTGLAVALYLPAKNTSSIYLQLGYAIVATASIAILIWQACDPFAEATQWIGIRFRIPGSIRGATLDAVASSMPELFSGIFFVTVAISATADSQQQLTSSTEGFGSSIAICAGSSIYNLILIPAICAIAISTVRPSRPQIEFSAEVVNRDGTWVIGAQLGLLIILYLPRLHWWMGLIGIGAYVVYIVQMYFDAKRFRRSAELDHDSLPPGTDFLFGFFHVRFSIGSVLLTLLLATLAAAAACYFLVELTNESAHAMGVPPFFVAVILAAAASSIPDTFVSLGSARRGDDSGAMSNVFGSNIFDICIGMSIPLLVCCYLNQWQPLDLVSDNRATIRGVAALRVLLFVLTAVAMYTMWTKRRITRRIGYFFCGMYILFVTYAVLGSFDLL